MSIEAMKQTPLVELLEAVPVDARLSVDDGAYSTTYHPVGRLCHEAAVILRQAIAEAEKQEPVAYVKTVIEALYENSDPISVEAAELLEHISTPPQRQPLTDEQIYKCEIESGFPNHRVATVAEMQAFARAIEAAHGIGEKK